MLLSHDNSVKVDIQNQLTQVPTKITSPSKKNIAWIFPGQGSQATGMTLDLWYKSHARMRLRQAENILGWSVSQVCCQEDLLNLTQYCQPCLFVFSSILADLLMQKGCQPDFVAGYSLGEYIALYTAGVFDFETGLNLIKQRAELMASAPPGIMVALRGCNLLALTEKILTIPDVEIISDELTQTIISGSQTAVESVVNQVTAIRKTHLKVSKPFHTQLMRPIELEFQRILNTIPFENAQIPVLSNTDPTPTVEAFKLKQRLYSHMTGKVRWQATVDRLAIDGVESIVEIGASRGLSKHLQAMQLDFSLHSITHLADLPITLYPSLVAH